MFTLTALRLHIDENLRFRDDMSRLQVRDNMDHEGPIVIQQGPAFGPCLPLIEICEQLLKLCGQVELNREELILMINSIIWRWLLESPVTEIILVFVNQTKRV